MLRRKVRPVILIIVLITTVNTFDPSTVSSNFAVVSTVRMTPKRRAVFLLVTTTIATGICLFFLKHWTPTSARELTITLCKIRQSEVKSSTTKHVASHVIKGCRPNLKHVRHYSQSQEDYALFKNYFNFPTICNGTYVEIGALNGITYSNTKFFEDTLNWTGVLIEAQPKNAKQLIKNRSKRRNVIITEAVCPESQTYVNFSGTRAVGGIPDLMTERHVKTFFKGKLPASVKVPCRPIGKMLREAGVKAIDFFIVDVEGAELMVLETMDWSIPVKVFVVEMGRGERDQMLADLLASKGYVKSTWNIRGFCLPGHSCTNNQVFENPMYTY